MATNWDDFKVASPEAVNEGGGVNWDDFTVVSEHKPPPEASDFSQAWKRGWAQLPELTYGAGAMLANTAEEAFGEGGLSTSAKNYFLKKYQEKAQENQQYAPSTSFTDAFEATGHNDYGKMVDWAQDAAGYTLAQLTQTVMTGGVGALGGKLALKSATEKMLAGNIAKNADKLALEMAAQKGLSGEAAVIAAESFMPEAMKIAGSRAAQGLGAGMALTAQNFGMEAGDIYGKILEEHGKTGEPITGDDLVRGLGAAGLAAFTETATDLFGLGAAAGRIKIGTKPIQEMTGLKGRAARGLIGASVGIPVEAGQEYVQTGLEQWGARQDLSSPEAQRERVEGAAMGAFGGGMAGGGIGLISGARMPTPEPMSEPTPALPPIAQTIEQQAAPIIQAETVDDALAEFRKSLVKPTGFGRVDEFAGFVEQEQADIIARRNKLAETQGMMRESSLESADARTLGQRISDTRIGRLSLLDKIYASNDRTPGVSFLKSLEREYPNNPLPTPEEKAIIAKRDQSWIAFNEQDTLPSIPNESDFGVKERTQPKEKPKQNRDRFISKMLETKGNRIKDGVVLNKHGKRVMTLTAEEIERVRNGGITVPLDVGLGARPAEPAGNIPQGGAGAGVPGATDGADTGVGVWNTGELVHGAEQGIAVSAASAGQGIDASIQPTKEEAANATQAAQAVTPETPQSKASDTRIVKRSGTGIAVTGFTKEDVVGAISGINLKLQSKVKTKGLPPKLIEARHKAVSIDAVVSQGRDGGILVQIRKGNNFIDPTPLQLGQIRSALIPPAFASKPTKKKEVDYSKSETLQAALKAGGLLGNGDEKRGAIGDLLHDNSDLLRFVPHELRPISSPNKPPGSTDEAADWILDHRNNGTAKDQYQLTDESIEARGEKQNREAMLDEAEKYGIKWKGRTNEWIRAEIYRAEDEINLAAIGERDGLSEEESDAAGAVVADETIADDELVDFDDTTPVNMAAMDDFFGYKGVENEEGNAGQIGGAVGIEQAQGTESGTRGENEPQGFLEAQTTQDLKERQAKLNAAEQERLKREADQAKLEKQRREREEVKRRSEGAAKTFELGQDAETNLSGQRSLLGEQKATAKQESGIIAIADIPAGTIVDVLRKKADGKMKQSKYDAKERMTKANQNVTRYKALLECIRG